MPNPEQPNVELETNKEAPAHNAELPAKVEQNQKVRDVERQTARRTEEISTAIDSKKAEKDLEKGLKEMDKTPAKPAEKDIVATLKAEGESFMNKFSKAKGMEKVGVLIEKFSELTEKVRDALLTIGRPMLLQIASMAEQFNLLGKPWIDQLRNLASSERAILQEMLKGKDFVLVRDIDKKNDVNALRDLQKRYRAKAEMEAKEAPQTTAPAADTPVTAANAETTPAPAPEVTPPKPTETYTFEEYVADVVSKAIDGHEWNQKTANEEGVKQLTLTEIVSILPA